MHSLKLVSLLLCGLTITVSANAAPRWGEFRAEQCTTKGMRQYSAVLWDIPLGQSWERACATMPANINGHQFSRPARCITNTNEWGQFDVPDASCPHWGAFKRDACTLPGKRQYSAILQDIAVGESWEIACAQTPATVLGQAFTGATRCSNQRTAMWGEFDVDDPGCSSPTGTAHTVVSLCPPGQTCVYRSPRYLNVYWAAPGTWDAEIRSAGLTATRASLDQFVGDVAGSAYYSGLAQYGVGQPSFAGSTEANAGCLAKFPVSTTADFARISGFVACQVNSMQLPSTDNLIVNLYLLPRVDPQWVNAIALGQTFKWAGCDWYYGYHALVPLALVSNRGAIAPTVPFAVMPLACGSKLPTASDRYNALTSVTSHEMVEAATNPGGFGWKNMSPNDMLASGNPLLEASDMCQQGSPLFPTPDKPFSNGKIAAYWSNSPPGCVFGGALGRQVVKPPLPLLHPPRK